MRRRQCLDCLGEKMPLILFPLLLIQQQCCNQTVTQKDNGTSCLHVAWPVIPAHDLWMERVWFLLAADVQWGPWETAAPRLGVLLPSIYKGKTQLNTLWAKQCISAAINVSTLIVFSVHPYEPQITDNQKGCLGYSRCNVTDLIRI